MKFLPQTSPDSVQAWTQEDFGFSPADTKAGLESALEGIFPPPSPQAHAPSSSTQSCAASSSFAELKPVPPLKALTQCDFVGSSGEASPAYYPPPEPGPGASPEVVSTTTSTMGELATDSVMMKPVTEAGGGIDAYLTPCDIADDDFAAIIGNAMVDPQLAVPEAIETELGNFTSSDMHDLEAWIEGQSQARFSAAAAAAAHTTSSSAGHTSLQVQYSSSSPMLQNLLTGCGGAGSSSGNGSNTGYARPPPPPSYNPMLHNIQLQQRLQRPIQLTYSPPSYTAPDTSLPTSSGGKKRRPAIIRQMVPMPISTEGTKDKLVHRCTICSRGFLNKSNIKVHLRTHTGEKPFKCETCSKAFRQKAHLLKHYNIHKRISRD